MKLLLAAACALAPLLQDAETEAKTMLERAESLARAERFDEARTLYRQLASKFPSTAAGAVGARRSEPSAFLGWKDLVRAGPSSNRVDVVLMGDGYTLEHMKTFDRLADDVPRLFERQKTFREYGSYLNFARADLVSAENGVDGFGRVYETALGGRVTGTIAGHVGIDRTKVAAMLAEVPDNDDLAVVFVRQGVLGTGGRGIAVVGGTDARTTIHEFGHAFAGLSDEYDAQQVVHPGPVRNGINVSSTPDPTKVPWAHWIAAKNPVVGVYEGGMGKEEVTQFVEDSDCLLMLGCGIGSFVTPNNASILQSVRPQRRGIANGVRSTLQNAGIMVGTALTLGVAMAQLPEDSQRMILGHSGTGLSAFDVALLTRGARYALLMLALCCVSGAVLIAKTCLRPAPPPPA